MDDEPDTLEKLFKKAVKCRVCFENKWVSPAFVDIAQPRWIGSHYYDSDPRILVVLINPGSWGDKSGNNSVFLELLREYRDTETTVDRVFEHQKQTICTWSDGDIAEFYLKGLNLDLEHVAFANIAWCATKGKPPTDMLNECFKRHTSHLIKLLDPQIVVLSGKTDTCTFEEKVISLLSTETQIICMYHYAYYKYEAERKGEATAERKKREELDRVRRLLWSENK